MSYSRTVPSTSRVRQLKPAAATPESPSFNSSLYAATTKHEQLKEVAEREASDYERYKATERQRIGGELMQLGPQPAGGSVLSAEELDERRRQQELDAKRKERYESIQRKKKHDQYQQEQKKKEQEEIDRKKQIQREKSERLEARKAASKEAELDDIRQKRLAYLEKNGTG